MKLVSKLFPLALGMLFFSCMTSTGTENPTPQGVLIENGGYSVSADGKKLIVKLYSPYCTGTVLSNPLVTDSTATFSISGDTLAIKESVILGNGGIVQENVILTRDGSGSGLQGGVWREISKRYPVISSGNLNYNDRVEVAQDSQLNSYDVRNVVFSKDSIYSYGIIQQADAFLARWIFSGSATTDSISTSYVSQNVAQLRGLRTGEIVTLTYSSDNKEVTYASNLAIDSTFNFYQYPKSCPDPESPVWFQHFVKNNLKQAPSSTSVSSPKVASNIGYEANKSELFGRFNFRF